MKDFLAETSFEKGWESVDRNFRKLSRAAEAEQEPRPDVIFQALDRLSSQVDLFADLWLHFHIRFEALVHEYNLQIEKGAPAERESDPLKSPRA